MEQSEMWTGEVQQLDNFVIVICTWPVLPPLPPSLEDITEPTWRRDRAKNDHSHSPIHPLKERLLQCIKSVIQQKKRHYEKFGKLSLH